ncbi:MAG: terminase family protein [Candidatus Caldarchaeum sp.]
MKTSEAAQLHLNLADINVKLYPWQRKFIDDGSRFRVLLKPRGAGATFTIAVEALAQAVLKPGSTIILVSYSMRQCLEIFRHVKNFAERLASKSYGYRGVAYSFTHLSGMRSAVLGNGSRIISLPNNPDTLRGYRADHVYVDEAALFRDDFKIKTAVMFTTVARRGRIVLASTPKGKRGWFYEAWISGGTWSKHLISYRQSPHITETDLEGLRNVMTELEWRQEMECEFLDEVNAFIPYEKILACVEDYPMTRPAEGSVTYLGVDFGRYRDSTVIIGVMLEDGWRMRVFHVEELVQKPFSEQMEAVRKAAEAFKPAAVAVDATGMGAPLAEALAEKISSLVPVRLTAAVKNNLINNLRNNLLSCRLIIPADATQLINQLRLFQQINTGAMPKFEAPAGQHDDHVLALALACYAVAADKTARVEAVSFWRWPSPTHLRT